MLMRRDGRATADTDSVAKALVEGYWQFGISVWTQRNQLEHGNQYSVSLLERERVQRCIKSAYDKFGSINTSDCEIKWMFGKSIEKRLEDTYDVQMAWLELLRKLYAHHEFEWFEPERRSCTHIEYVEEGIHGRSLSVW